MTKRETKIAEKLLRDHVDRIDSCGADTSGGWCITAHWLTGGQRLFYTLSEVRKTLGLPPTTLACN